MSSYKILSLSGSDPALRSYEAMIYSDFLKSLRYGNEWYSLIDSDRYFGVYKQVIASLLKRPLSNVRLAVLTDDPDTCLGWSLSEGKSLHYVFVKKDTRLQGIATELLPKNFTQVTHLTKAGRAIWCNKYQNAIFDPFLV